MTHPIDERYSRGGDSDPPRRTAHRDDGERRPSAPPPPSGAAASVADRLKPAAAAVGTESPPSLRLYADVGVQSSYCCGSGGQSLKALASQPPLVNAMFSTSSFNRASWLQRPHTLTVLWLTVLVLVGCVWYNHVFPAGTRGNIIRGIASASGMFLVFAMVQLPDGILLRPWPPFWRLVKGVSVLYLALLVFLLFQDLPDVRGALRRIDPELMGKTVVETNYAESCAIFTPLDWRRGIENLTSRLDIFFAAHFFGWFAKALVVRDAKLLWCLSLMFEWAEITFRYALPNFWECWWDHLLLDVFGCNWLGIYVGLRVCKAFKFKEYRWRVEKPLLSPPAPLSPQQQQQQPGLPVAPMHDDDGESITTRAARLPSAEEAPRSPPSHTYQRDNGSHPRAAATASKQRDSQRLHTQQRGRFSNACTPLVGWWRSSVQSFLPYSWTEYRWPSFFSNTETYSSMILFSLGVTLLDLNYFFLKAELHLEPGHWICGVRAFFWAAAAAAGTRELYDYLTSGMAWGRAGVQLWLDTAMVTLETLLAVKFRNGLQDHEGQRPWIAVAWVVIVVTVLSGGLWVAVRSAAEQAKRTNDFAAANKTE
eukprot:GHVU01061547.1.p1 GENE.GHVU01061547.1~~GHVU01061547.1.p1  ORF type:complete len:594 (-),score=93.36 GHVU01061547.1:765-2546(-)